MTAAAVITAIKAQSMTSRSSSDASHCRYRSLRHSYFWMRRRPSRTSAPRAPIYHFQPMEEEPRRPRDGVTHPDWPCERRIVVPAPLQSLEQRGREIALGEGRHDHDDRLARHAVARPDPAGGAARRPRRDAARNSLVAREGAGGFERLLAGHRRDFVDDRAIENVGNESRPDALDLVRAGLPARQDRALGRLDRDDAQRRPARLEHLADAGDRTARADPGPEGADLP